MSHHRNEDPDIFYRNGGVFRCRLNGLVFIRNFRFPGLRKNLSAIRRKSGKFMGDSVITPGESITRTKQSSAAADTL
jgi:hypothetical protein